jgi:polar amino acid transport system substrate-binding protein
MQRVTWLFVGILLLLPACAPAETTTDVAFRNDKLAEILARGTLVIATDANYEPQSKLLSNSSPAPNTKCSSTQYTASQMTGFDIAVAREVARRLGVEPCFVTPPWNQLVAGHWGDHWDVHVGSVAITFDRLEILYFSQPYYATPTVILLHKDNMAYQRAEDLSGKRIGVCVGCTFEAYLNGTLQIPGEEVEFRIQNAEIVAYETEAPAIEDLSAGEGGKLDAVLTILPLAQQAIAAGKPVKIMGEPIWFAYASITMDRFSKRDSARLLSEISKIIADLHAEGLLKQLSLKYQEQDLTQEAARYDVSALSQLPQP